jgi:hypothetical protein
MDWSVRSWAGKGALGESGPVCVCPACSGSNDVIVALPVGGRGKGIKKVVTENSALLKPSSVASYFLLLGALSPSLQPPHQVL